MKRLVVVLLALCLLLPGTIPAQSRTQTTQLLQGTQIRLVLLHGLTSSVAREGDPFSAVVAEPVYMGNQLILPAGARVNGEVGSILRPKRFAMFRGQAAMALYIRTIELDHREIPAPMSILSIHETSAVSAGPGKKRGDLKTEEGTLVQQRRDIKGDVKWVALGTSGGSVVGVVFSNVMRGFVIGLVGSSAYVVTRKGKEVELPAQTGLLVRTDSTITLPAVAAQQGAVTGQP